MNTKKEVKLIVNKKDKALAIQTYDSTEKNMKQSTSGK